MKFRMYFIGLVLGLILFGCGEARDVKQYPTEKAKKYKIENENGQTVVNKDGQTIISHKFGELILKKNISSNSDFFFASNVEGYNYYERYPNIINKQKWQGSKWLEIQFFNKKRTKILKTIDLKSSNPYLIKYENIKYGYPSFEEYEAPPENEKELYKGVMPDNYLTFYDAGTTYNNGFSSVVYNLISLKQNKILSWQSTIIIWGINGNVIGEITEENSIYPCGISNDGNLILFRYGRSPDNPYDDAIKGEYRIFDLINMKDILKIIPDEGFSVTSAGMENLDIFRLGFIGKSPKHFIIDLIDLNSRRRLSKKILIKELVEINKKNEFKSFYDLRDQINFTKTTF